MFPFILSIWFRFVSPNWVLLFTASVFHFFPLFPLSAAGTKNLKLNIFAFYISHSQWQSKSFLLLFLLLYSHTPTLLLLLFFLFVLFIGVHMYGRTDGHTHIRRRLAGHSHSQHSGGQHNSGHRKLQLQARGMFRYPFAQLEQEKLQIVVYNLPRNEVIKNT